MRVSRAFAQSWPQRLRVPSSRRHVSPLSFLRQRVVSIRSPLATRIILAVSSSTTRSVPRPIFVRDSSTSIRSFSSRIFFLSHNRWRIRQFSLFSFFLCTQDDSNRDSLFSLFHYCDLFIFRSSIYNNIRFLVESQFFVNFITFII